MSRINHPIVSRAEWLNARRAHLDKEKEATKVLERLHEERRALPWVKVDKNYVFNSPSGAESLADLFCGKSQLILYHFMFAPGWSDGCTGCSFLADHFDGVNLHLQHHDVSLVAASRAPFQEFQAFKKRMGWQFKWVSSAGSDFNYDYHVSFSPDELNAGKVVYNFGPIETKMEDIHGVSVFCKQKDEVFHTYSAYARGCDVMIGVHHFLDLTPMGRNENTTMNWVRLHDQYELSPKSESCCSK